MREDEARNLAQRKETDLVHQAVAQGMLSIRQALSEELDRLEGRLEGNHLRPVPPHGLKLWPFAAATSKTSLEL